MAVPILSAVFVAALVTVLVMFYRRLRGPKALPLPPGPKGLPLLGNLWDLPAEKDWLTYSDWQKIHGDLIYMKILGQSFVIVSSIRIAADLLERRSTYYSGRMHFTFAGELCDFNRVLTFKEGDPQREARKYAHRGLNATAMKQWEGLQEREALKTLKRLLESPDEFVKHFQSNASSTMMMISYGYELKRDDDPLLLTVTKALENFSAACHPGRWLVDFVPLLKYVPEWFPGATFHKYAREWRADADSMFNVPFDIVKERMSEGTAIPSLTSQLLETKKGQTQEEHIKHAIGSLYGGASDTTPSALNNFVIAMILFPHVQTKAREELDQVSGSERLPAFTDRGKLPYLNALVKEVLRWGTVLPMGIPHRLIKDDEYNGYRIPKDTIIMTNNWHMSRNKEIYGEDVEIFRPERFLETPAAPRGFNTANTREFGSPAFGFGRRVCPGEHLAEKTLFIMCSNILATTTISPMLGGDGKGILPEVDYTSGVIVHVKPFKCNITPRSTKIVESLLTGSSP